MSGHPGELLSAYADGELPPEEAARIEAHLRSCTECTRELKLIQKLGGAMRNMQTSYPRSSIWAEVNRRITRPIGWVLLIGGGVLWLGLALLTWFREELTLEWFAATAIGLGLVLLAIGVAHEQYRDWKGSPYKDVER